MSKRVKPSRARLNPSRRPKLTYEQKAEFVEPLVGKRYSKKKLSPVEKSQLTHYFNFASGIAVNFKPVHVPAKDFKRIQRDVNEQFTSIRGVKKTKFANVILAPIDRPNVGVVGKGKAKKYVFKGGTKETKGRIREAIPFSRDLKSRKKLATDPKGYVEGLLKGRKFKKGTTFRFYTESGWSPSPRASRDTIGTVLANFADTDSGEDLQTFVDGLYVDYE